MLTVDRVALLRRVGIFSATPGHVLAGLAGRLVEQVFPAGAQLIAAGASEDWLYVVTSGEVDVERTDGGRVRLTPPAVVGELAVLVPQPRSASVTAVTDVVAHRLSKADFDEALERRPEVARGVITALVERLRETREPSEERPR